MAWYTELRLGAVGGTLAPWAKAGRHILPPAGPEGTPLFQFEVQCRQNKPIFLADPACMPMVALVERVFLIYIL